MMRLAKIGACLVLFLLFAGLARAEFVETWSTPGNLEDWFAAGGTSLTSVPASGGNPGGYLRAERTGGFAWASSRDVPELNGDIWGQHGNDLILTVDFAVLSPDDTTAGFWHRLRGPEGVPGNESWSAKLSGPGAGGTQSMSDGWVTYQIPLNRNWTDEEAIAAGWEDAASESFSDWFADLGAAGTSDVMGLGPLTDGGTPGSVTGYDNYGFIENIGGSPDPTDWTWDAVGLGSWNAGANWTPGGGPPNATFHTAIFAGAIGANSTVVVDSPVTVNRIQFTNTANSYAIGGTAAVNLSATTSASPVDPSISVAGNHQFQASVNTLNDTTVNVASGATLEFINRLNLNNNTLTKTGDGTLLINSSFDLGGGTVTGLAGTIKGGGTVGGNLDNSGATVAPGNSPGILSVAGNYTQGGGGTLEIEIMGTNPGEGGHDQLNVTGSASLNGTLDIQTDAGFTPGVGAMPGMVGDSFVIITAASRTGEFSTVNGRHMGAGKFYKVGYNPTNVSLGAFQALGGDTEGDLDVDITDFNTLAGNFGGTGAEWTDGDFDDNADVDITDFNILAGNFGGMYGSDGPGQVPEPSAILMLGMGIVSLSWLFRRKTRT